MSNIKLSFEGKFIAEVQPLIYPKLYAVPCKLTEYPVIVHRLDGNYVGTYTGEVWRVCGDNHCYINVFPTKEAAEMFIEQPIMLGGLGYD